MIGITLGALLQSSCSSTSNLIGDHLPEWAGGLPADVPPRRGTPGFDTYMRQVDGEPGQAANAPPAQAPAAATAAAPPPRAPNDRAAQPIH
jgi:hypothetical protein